MEVAMLPTRRRPPLAVLGLALGFALLSLPGCAGMGGFNLISLEEEWRLGQQIEADLARQLTLVQDRDAQAYVDRIGQQIVRQTTLNNVPWRFHIVADPRINAFNVPGGLVYVNTGLIAAATDVGMFTGVVAHEVAHGAQRHATQQMSRAYGINILAAVALGQNPPIYQQIIAQIAAQGSFARFSRAFENEADRFGVRYMYDAGYDPAGMARMFQVLLAERRRNPGGVERFFSTHPLTEDRIQSIQQLRAELPPRAGLINQDPAYDAMRRRVGGIGR
jgi:beta-barrel assembly-enhancing protease